MPLWEDVRPGTAQRYRRLRYGRGSQHDWRLNTSASTIRTRFGPAISIPTTDGAELEGAKLDASQVMFTQDQITAIVRYERSL